MNRSLAGEVVGMALDTLRTNKLRSALTILGVVIGITAIVGMTSLIRGFDESLRDQVRALGPSTIFVSKISILSISSGVEFSEILRRPNLTMEDAKAIEKLAPSIDIVDVMLGYRHHADHRAAVLPRRPDQPTGDRRRHRGVRVGQFRRR